MESDPLGLALESLRVADVASSSARDRLSRAYAHAYTRRPDPDGTVDAPTEEVAAERDAAARTVQAIADQWSAAVATLNDFAASFEALAVS